MNMSRALALVLAVSLPGMGTDLVLRNAPAQVYFSPRGGCEEAVVATIDGAREQVLVQMYTFTSAPIAAAMKRAHDRGVDVRVILDKSQRTERYSGLTYLVHAGIPVWVDDSHPIAHNKVMMVDSQIVATGSFNYTKAASQANAENLLIIRDPALTAIYIANWEAHRNHAHAAD